jgi:hypothetical protein
VIRIKDEPPMKDVTPAELSKAEAKKLTQKIKTAVDELWTLLLEAHDRKAWKALGYATWEAYVKAEFDMSRQNSYRLLNQARVVREIEEIVPRAGQISQRDAEALKDDLPAAAEQIKAKVDAGEEPEKAVAETVAAKRAEKEQAKADKAAQQAENDRRREEHAAALPQAIKDRQAAKADAIAARKAKPVDIDALTADLEELREANAALEAEVTALKADNAKWEAMRVQFEQGGFEKVIAGKDEEIRVLLTRVESESRDKAAWANKAKFWKDEAIKLGWKNGDFTIDIETGEIADA